MIRPTELDAIRNGKIDLAFRRWDRARVKVGTRLRTAVGVIEVVSVETLPVSSLRAEDARRCGAPSLAALKVALNAKPTGRVFRVGLRFAGADPRETLRATLPDDEELTEIQRALDRLDAASPVGAWTRATLRVIDASPEVRAPELAEGLGRPTAEFKRDVRKLKERGLTESLAIGYRLSPRGEALLDHEDGPRVRAPRRSGTPLPRAIGASATRALRVVDVHTVDAVATWTRADLAALPGVGPVALQRIDTALTEIGLGYATPGETAETTPAKGSVGAPYAGPMAMLTIAQDPAADKVLSEDPFALLTGMLLDQQFPMERAFAGPAKVLERFGTLDPAALAATEPEAFADLCATPPAVHRYGRSMAGRIQALATVVRDEYDGDASRIWSDASTGAELFDRIKKLPGFGEQKAKIFVALLAKQLDVRPDGWDKAAGDYSEEGSFRSVADVVDGDSLQKVRDFKKAAKAAAKAAKD